MQNESALGILHAHDHERRCSGDDLNLYLEGALFEFRSGHFYLVFLSFPTCKNLKVSRYEHDRFLPNNLQFVLRQMFQRRRP